MISRSSAPEPYQYEGWCDHCQSNHYLPRTAEAVAAAGLLMTDLGDENGDGRMYGVLVGETSNGKTATLRAFSGRATTAIGGATFVGPTRSDSLTADTERDTLRALSALSSEIRSLSTADLQNRLAAESRKLDHDIAGLRQRHLRSKALRHAERNQPTTAPQSPAAVARLQELDDESARERSELRKLRRQRKQKLAPLQDEIDQRLERQTKLRRERRRKSSHLQTKMHDTHGLVNFAARYAALPELFARGGIPSGAGECCAPKLLQAAAQRNIRPTGIAEFWWGPPPPDQSKAHGEYYGACEQKCAPLLGHQLCGAGTPRPMVEILYQDQDIIIVDKPAGLLSVRGRSSSAQDSIEARLQLTMPEEYAMKPAHRLDQATSGLLVIARNPTIHAALSSAFAKRQVDKTYGAIVGASIEAESGIINLRIRADSKQRPHQIVDPSHGKASETFFRVLKRDREKTRLELQPRTGRTHQLRVHCAAAEGLAAPIIGDHLYGGSPAPRMMLHAHQLSLRHPSTGQPMSFESPVPF